MNVVMRGEHGAFGQTYLANHHIFTVGQGFADDAGQHLNRGDFLIPDKCIAHAVHGKYLLIYITYTVINGGSIVNLFLKNRDRQTCLSRLKLQYAPRFPMALIDAVDIHTVSHYFADVFDLAADSDRISDAHFHDLRQLIFSFYVTLNVLENILVLAGVRTNADVITVTVDDRKVSFDLHILILEGFLCFQRITAEDVKQFSDIVVCIGDLNGFFGILFRRFFLCAGSCCAASFCAAGVCVFGTAASSCRTDSSSAGMAPGRVSYCRSMG